MLSVRAIYFARRRTSSFMFFSYIPLIGNASYGQVKPTYCYRLLTEGSMEQKIYSRAAAKSSLSDLVIDQANPERCFTKQEMDLLRKEDTWVSCEYLV